MEENVNGLRRAHLKTKNLRISEQAWNGHGTAIWARIGHGKSAGATPTKRTLTALDARIFPVKIATAALTWPDPPAKARILGEGRLRFGGIGEFARGAMGREYLKRIGGAAWDATRFALSAAVPFPHKAYKALLQIQTTDYTSQ